jgi:hypothetical protein
MYLKTDDEKVYTNTAGSWGVVGDMGGSRWTSGTSAPSGGEDGDFYLKTDDEKVYERVSGSWVVKLDIGGGVWTSSTSNGTGGESGDWHVNTTTKDIQENVSGTWTTRVNLSVSGTNLSDLANVPALDSGKFLTNDGTNTSWATVDVTGASVGGDVSGTVSNIQIAANAVTDTELNSAKLNGIASGAEVNPSFKTVGGSSILGSGDIATLPSGGTVGQVVTNTASGTGGWGDVSVGNYSIHKLSNYRLPHNSSSRVEVDGTTDSLDISVGNRVSTTVTHASDVIRLDLFSAVHIWNNYFGLRVGYGTDTNASGFVDGSYAGQHTWSMPQYNHGGVSLSVTITGLTPGQQYWFKGVGASHGAHAGFNWNNTNGDCGGSLHLTHYKYEGA